jgi:hypothetical protein
MPPHIPTGLLIITVVSLIAGWFLSASHKPKSTGARKYLGDDCVPRLPRKGEAEVEGSLFKPVADALFFWIAKDLRYLIAYPALMFAFNALLATCLPDAYPSRVMHCQGDIPACLELDAWRSWGEYALRRL